MTAVGVNDMRANEGQIGGAAAAVLAIVPTEAPPIQEDQEPAPALLAQIPRISLLAPTLQTVFALAVQAIRFTAGK